MARPVYLSHLAIVNPLGRGPQAVFDTMVSGASPGVVRRTDLMIDGAPAYVGAVDGPLPAVPGPLGCYASRNAAMIIEAAEQLRAPLEAPLARVGPQRIAVVLGTSTSGIDEGERAVSCGLGDGGTVPADFDIRQQEIGSPAELLARYLGLEAPAYCISTACSSGAHALAAGRRLLLTGLADVVLAGGADSLCRLTVNGFHALSALSPGRCNPFSRNRDGTMIGEGAAIFMMQREPAEVALLGVGASSDAHSMTAPEPEGVGVELAVRQALGDADIAPEAIDYIQLHGTGTLQNDAMESRVVHRVFGTRTPCSSSKGQIGHTLGAAGAMGAAHCWLAARSQNADGLLPPHLWDGEAEEGLLSDTLVRPGQTLPPGARRTFLSQAFAFGGSNVALVIGRQS